MASAIAGTTARAGEAAMADLIFAKGARGLVPSDERSEAWFRKLRAGGLVRVKAFTMRNPKFHRKFFAMLKVAYDNWPHPTVETPYGPAECSLDQFRNDVICMAGYGELVANVRGEWRFRAKSIAFHRMGEDQFEDLYSAVLRVILRQFLTNWSGEDMERAVALMEDFDGG